MSILGLARSGRTKKPANEMVKTSKKDECCFVPPLGEKGCGNTIPG